MSTLKDLWKELPQESVVTRKMLELVPSDQYDWRPHERSMTMKALAGHLAELPGWITMAFDTTELDFAAGNYVPPVWNSTEELLSIFDLALQGAMEHLQHAQDADLLPMWELKNGDQVLMTMTKGEMMRHAVSQTIHHRAQLGVYLRLLDIPIPGTYGPSADDQSF